MTRASTFGAAEDEFGLRQSARPDGSVLLSVSGDLDLGTVPQVRAELDRLAAEHRTVALDLSAVRFMDSTGVHLLMEATNDARRDGWTFMLTRDLSAEVARLFDLTSVRDVLPFEGRRES